MNERTNELTTHDDMEVMLVRCRGVGLNAGRTSEAGGEAGEQRGKDVARDRLVAAGEKTAGKYQPVSVCVVLPAGWMARIKGCGRRANMEDIAA